MTANQMLALIRDVRFASDLTHEDQLKLAEISELVEFEDEKVIFSEGDSAPYLFLLIDGRVQLCMSIPAQGCVPVLTLERGDLLGWSPSLGRSEMTTTAIALKNTKALQIDAERLKKLCDDDHDIGYELMRRVAMAVSQRLVATRLQVLDLFVQPSSGGSS